MAVPLLDNHSPFRRDLIRKRFAHGIDVIRFYCFLGKIAAIPVIGTWFMRPIINLYYRYFDTNSLILPLPQIEELLESCRRFSIDPCDCRVEYGNQCNSSLYTCLRLNFAAEVSQEDTGTPAISKEDALRIARNAHRHGLVFSLEQCIQPYQFNICMCCSCCCAPWQMRYTFGHDVFHSGPYIPEFESTTCKTCQVCVEKCPTDALSLTERGPEVDWTDCLGCGLCCTSCPEQAITMVKKQERIRKDTEPGFFRLLAIKLFMYGYMFPMLILFRFFAGSHQYKREHAMPTEKDVYTP